MPYPAVPLAGLSGGALETLGNWVTPAFALIEGAYQRAPTLVLALSALVILPAVALISVAIRASRRRRGLQAARRAAERRAQASGLTGDMPEAGGLPEPQSQAWLTVEGAPGTMALAGKMIRIGRHEDNDIRLADRSVHRHHAVIERAPDESFSIRDVSGKDGNGVRVNGQRTERARLADGDLIELGRARLRFENAPV